MLPLNTYTYKAGNTISIPYYYQDAKTPLKISFYLDNDTNPYNGYLRVIRNPETKDSSTGIIKPPPFNWNTFSSDAGTYAYIQVKAEATDGTGWVHYDYLFTPISINAESTAPDLTALSVTAPTQATTGETIPVTFTVKNLGNGATGNFGNRISLATSAYGTDIRLGDFSMTSLAPNESGTETRYITISASTSPGRYWITVYTDGPAPGLVNESNEGNNIGSTAPYQINIVSPTYSITASAGAGGSVNPSGSFTKAAGTDQTFTSIPSAGYMVGKWFVDGNAVQSGGIIYILSNIQANHSVQVTFENQPSIIRLEGDLNFGAVQVGGSVQRPMTIYNDGNSMLTVSSISYPPGFSGNWSGTIGAGSSRQVTVTFSPTEQKTYTGNVTVTSNATSVTNTMPVSGTGTTSLHNVTATINSISPNPATQGTTVNFSGTGSDSSGHSITAYSWRSSIDGNIGTSASFGKNDLSVGSHNIYFKVQCSNGTWSPETSWSENPLVIGQLPSHPVVTATSPADGAVGVAVNTTINATFSESIDASTISDYTFTIRKIPDLFKVTGTVTYDDTTKKATFTPSENLNYLTKYTATVTKDVKDLAGNPITDEYSWSFTTVPEPTPTPTPTPTVTEVAPKVSGGHWHTIALKSDGTVWTWGHNFDGELGDGTTNTRYIPAQVDGLSNVIAIGAGNYHTIALKSDGTIWMWGHNGSGELGDGTTSNRTTPIQVSGLSGVSAIAGGVFHTIALKLDGTVWTWGANWVGQLGDGTTMDKSTPVQVSGLSEVIAIDGAYHHTAALKSDGTVWTWGANDYGQLGDGTNTNRTTPVQVNGLIDVTAIACGDDHTIALKSDGTVWAWGHNDDGQLGDETTNDRPTPVQVGGLSGVTAIAAGDDHTVVLKSDKTVWAWGNNGDGQLGDRTTTNRTAPVQVIGLGDVTTIGAGNYHTIAMKADGTVWTWGANNDGQLGDGTNTNESTPVQANINLIQTVTPTPNQTPTGMPIPTVGPTPLPTPSPTPTSVVTPTPSPTPTTTPPPIPTPIPGNIEFHYTFDEGVGTVAHDSASSNDGTINGATWTTGKDGSGLSFNGNDDSVQIPGFMGQPQNITISAWAKLSSNDINGAEVISLGDHVALRLDGTGSKGVMGFYYDGATWRTTTTGISYAGTGWHHFVYVVDDANTMQKIYVDGVERGSTAHTQPISYAGLGANTLIGKHGNGSGNYDFNGVIDDVCVYNRALNAQEILALYDQLPAQATAPYARSSMTIDGNLTESSWDITTDVSNVVIGTANNTVKFGVLWDSTYLYVGMTVLDDTLHNDSTYVHEDDSVEIYIDGDHNHSITYDSYDRQFIKGWNDSTLFEQHGKKTDVLHGWAPISGGYSIELSIPWSNLGVTPTAGMTIGFSVGYNDDDDGSGREGQAVWIGTADNYLDTSALGDIVLEEPPPSVTVPYVSTNLDVDGNVSESDWNITYDVSKVVIGTTNNTVKFGVLWNSACLYVGMEVLDGNLYNDSTYVHEDDSVEIYIDGDHNHGTTYDSYDRQFLKGWFDSALVEQHGKTAGVLHGWAPIPGGYSIELAIPWSNLGITPAAGVTLGFSVGYNDDDNGEGRDGQAVWIGTANNWRDTSALGDIVLGAASPPTPTPLPTPIATPLLTPTPTLLSGGLDALYAFDEGIGTVANDLSGNDNHGTINGATWTIGKTDWALSFDGVNDYVDLGNPSNLQPGAVSLSVWFKTTAASGMIMRKRGYGYGLEVVSSGKISFWIYNATATKFMATSLNAYNDDQWHHAVGVYDGSTVKLFIDGSKVSAESADPIFYGSGGIAIGRDGNYSGSYFNGIIDEVQVYNYALSDPEIQGLYNANTGASSMASLHSLDLNKDTDNARITPSTGIALKSFHAEVDHDGSVSLHWETAAEVDTAGFNLYRSRHKTGRYTKINNSLINARSDDPSGTRYNFMDEPGHGKSYYYKLENEDPYGKSTMYDTIKVRKKSSGNE
ncbi:MAG: Ig-like domain-containing protein [Planctomycetia bacterium]|nr:Ig-like domain-containing protein [Planctomycetia bacterium]